MLDKMNQVVVDRDDLLAHNAVADALENLVMNKCISVDKDNMEFIIKLTCFERDKLLKLLDDVSP